MAFISRAASMLFAASVVFGIGCGVEQNELGDLSTGKGSGSGSGASLSGFVQVNLVSDQAGVAKFVDPDLVNSWGLAMDDTAFWIADNGSGRISIVDEDGSPANTERNKPDLEVGITGIARNQSTAFQMHGENGCGAAAMLVSSESGKIYGVNATLSSRAQVLIDRSKQGAVYKGIAIIQAKAGMEILATDFHNGHIDVFDENFKLISQRMLPPAGAEKGGHPIQTMFVDHSLPKDYAPFNVAMINGKVYITYAKQDADKMDDVAGAGLGRVDIFDLEGKMIRVLHNGGQLNAPWGLALAPADFCHQTANQLIVGNFGDGTLLAMDPDSGRTVGQLMGTDHKVLKIDGLWALMFGDGKNVGAENALYFTAGPNDEKHGLFGRLQAAE